MTKLRVLWQNVNASYWFYPALFSIMAVLLASLTIWLDRIGWSAFLSDRAILIPARPQGASNMLTVIAGSMIGVASTVFSITIAAVAYASGAYGPRLLTNFMEDRGNQFSLAMFIATFVYALTVLRSVRMADEAGIIADSTGQTSGFVPQLSLLTAFGLTGISVAVLVYFLNHIPDSIRINSVLQGIGSRLLGLIEGHFPEENKGTQPPHRPDGIPIIADNTGYIQIIDYPALQHLAKLEHGRFVLMVRTGDFVHPDMEIFHWCPDDKANAAPPNAKARDCIVLGTRRTPNQDLNFLIDELVEIALRALSPGINDPFTAITSIHWLGAATAQLARRDLGLKLSEAGEDEGLRVVPLDDGFGHYLDRGFGAMRSGAAGNRIAALRLLDALGDAATTLNNESRRAMIRREADLLLEQARLELRGPELAPVEARHASLMQRLQL